MNTPTPRLPEPSTSPCTWLSRWASLLAILLACGILSSSIAPTAAWADDHQEHEEHDDEEHEEEDWEEEAYEFEWFMAELEAYGQLLALVLQFDEIASDASKSGVAAVMAVEEHIEESSEAVEIFEEMLPKVSDATIKRAIRLKLVDYYADMDQPEKSIEQLKLLMLGEDK